MTEPEATNVDDAAKSGATTPSVAPASLREPCPYCGCPGEKFDGHVCEDFAREPLWCLCCNCGVITIERSWTYWQAKDDWDDEADKWRRSEHGEGDPMCRCPECGWEHVDDDSGPGLYLGALEEMRRERARIADDYAEAWADALLREVEA